MTQVRADVQQGLEKVLDTRHSCRIAGISRATLYRGRTRAGASRPESGAAEPSAPTPRTPPPNRLTDTERDRLLAALNSPEYREKSPRQVWAGLLDDGVYLGSVSTMYRILRHKGLSRERRAQAAHPAKAKPHLVATAPNRVWSWDITKLPTPWKGQYFDLYVMIDIFSRCVVHWEVHATETGELAAGFIKHAIRANGGIAPDTIHADRGTSMTSLTVGDLLEYLGIAKSHSRPKVSNDNPYSEAAFKTLKYCPAFPANFGSIHAAREFAARFFDYYNHEHYHTGIALHTPFSVHIGTAETIQAKRAATLAAFRNANPHRFTRPPSLPALPANAWINEPDDDLADQLLKEAATA